MSVFKYVYPFVLLTMVSGCSVAELSESDDNRLSQLTYQVDEKAAYDIAKPNSHFQKGLALINKSNPSMNDLYFARAAFEHAAVASVDDPLPYLLLGYTHYEIGNYEESYKAFITSASLDRSKDGYLLASIAAIRAGHELLGQAFYNRSKSENFSRSDTIVEYMNRVYQGPGRKVVASTNAQQASIDIQCPKLEGEKKENTNKDDDENKNVSKTSGNDKNELDATNLCDESLLVEVFIVERTSQAGSRVGQDLVSKISVGLSGSILDLSMGNTTSVVKEIVNADSNYSKTDEDSSSLGNNLTIDLAGINYALSVAADLESVTYVNSSPSINARLGQESTLVVGSDLSLIAQSSDMDPINKEAGMKVKINISQFNSSSVVLSSEIEYSKFLPPVYTSGFAKIEADKSNLNASVKVNYNKPVILGSLDLVQREDIGSGQKGLREAPVLGYAFGTSSTALKRKELAILATIRPPASLSLNDEEAVFRSLKKAGISKPSTASRAQIIYQAPDLSGILKSILKSYYR